MSARERTSTTSKSGGYSGAYTWQYPGGPYGEPATPATVQDSASFCGDQTGPGDNMPLIVDRWRNTGGIISKPFDGYWSSWFYNYVADINRGSHESFLGTDAPGDVFVATKAAAATNPSKPYVDVPTAITEELRDSVFRIRDAGRGLFAQAGNANLHYQFAIRPVVGDLNRLLMIQREIDRRVRMIERLKIRGYRSNYQQGMYSAQATEGRYVQSAGELMYSTFQIETTQRVWAHCRWAVADHDMSSMDTPAEMRDLAIRSALGLTVDPLTAWNLTPWTWLGDWFGSVGSYLGAQRNIIPATLIEVVVMRHAITLATCPSVSYSNIYGIPVNMTGIARTRERKSRAYSYISPFAAHLPFLDGRQMGILGSLAATGGRTRHSGR